MAMFDRLKHLKERITGRVKAARIVGYYNGACPLCDVHIGTDIIQDWKGKRSARCGACGREIFQLIDHSKIRWLKPYEPAQRT